MVLPQSAGDTLRVPAGVEGMGAGLGTTAIRLTTEEIRMLNSAASVATTLTLGTPAGSIVTIRSTDQLRVRIWGQFSARVQP